MATNKKECICDLKSHQQNHGKQWDQGKPERHTPVADEHKSTLESVRSKTRSDDGPEIAT